MLAKSVRDLQVYQTAFQMQQRVFDLSHAFPREERYSLTDQIRRSSRSVGANISEAWAKRRYPAHFVTKLSDADGEMEETVHWIETACACDYLNKEQKDDVIALCLHIGGMLNKMMANPQSWCKSYLQKEPI